MLLVELNDDSELRYSSNRLTYIQVLLDVSEIRSNRFVDYWDLPAVAVREIGNGCIVAVDQNASPPRCTSRIIGAWLGYSSIWWNRQRFIVSLNYIRTWAIRRAC